MKILSAVYSHPGFFPPTLNALHELAKHYDVYSLSRNVLKSTSLSKKIKSYTVGKYMDIRSIEKISIIAKIVIFFKYCLKMRQIIVKEKIDIVLLYDNIPLFAYWLVQKFFLKKRIVWYHNHDILEVDKVRKYSIQWFSGKFEHKIFKKINIFSLPVNERKQFFDLTFFKGKYFLIPNFPSKLFYRNYKQNVLSENNTVLKIVYQGQLRNDHGFEELLSVLSTSKNNNLELHLIGYIKESYKQKLLKISRQYNCYEKVFFHKRVDFNKLPEFTNKHHIGWAVHKPVNIQYATGSSASNKIYEYIAVGLPVILYDTKHYKDSLGKYEWAHFTDLTKDNILKTIEDIYKNYNYKSKVAITDFENELNYETNFTKAIDYLSKIASKSIN